MLSSPKWNNGSTSLMSMTMSPPSTLSMIPLSTPSTTYQHIRSPGKMSPAFSFEWVDLQYSNIHSQPHPDNVGRATKRDSPPCQKESCSSTKSQNKERILTHQEKERGTKRVTKKRPPKLSKTDWGRSPRNTSQTSNCHERSFP